MPTLNYLFARAKEATTWGGIAATVLGLLHVSASSDLINAILGLVAAIGGVGCVLIPEKSATSA